METLGTIVWSVLGWALWILSWVLWLVWEVLIYLFWSVFGIPLLIMVVIVGILLWRVGFRGTLTRLKEMRHAALPAARAIVIAIISLVSVILGMPVLQKLPKFVQRALVGGTSLPAVRTEVVRVTKMVYRCGPIARQFNVFTIMYDMMQLSMVVVMIALLHSLVVLVV